MNKKWRKNYNISCSSIHLYSTSCRLQLTGLLGLWMRHGDLKNFIMTHQHTKSRNHFPLKRGTLTIGGACKFLGVWRIFAQISPNLPEKNSKENDLQKNDYISSHVECICLNQSTIQAPLLNLPKSPLTCPKRTKQKHDLWKKKKTSAPWFWVPFL